MNWENTDCDLCKSKTLESIYASELCVDYNKNEWKKINFVICKNCGLVFENPRMSFDSMKMYYSEEVTSNVNYATGSNGEVARKKQFEFIKKYVPQNGKILDIGARDNSFIKYWIDENYPVYALEPGPSLREKPKDFTLINQYYEEYNPNFKFDMISIRHVLEHTFSPSMMLEKAWNELNDGGLLFVEVPNVYDPFITMVPFFIYYHTFHFSPDTLKSYLKKFGFSTLEFQELPYNSMRVVAKKAVKDPNFISSMAYAITKEKIKKYVSMRNLFLDNAMEKLRDVGEKVAIFGAGEHSVHLIRSTGLDLSKINCFIDSDHTKQGKKYFNLPVYSPEIMKTSKFDTIIISSYDYQDEISAIIRKYDSTTKIIKFYDQVVAYDTFVENN